MAEPFVYWITREHVIIKKVNIHLVCHLPLWMSSLCPHQNLTIVNLLHYMMTKKNTLLLDEISNITDVKYILTGKVADDKTFSQVLFYHNSHIALPLPLFLLINYKIRCRICQGTPYPLYLNTLIRQCHFYCE